MTYLGRIKDGVVIFEGARTDGDAGQEAVELRKLHAVGGRLVGGKEVVQRRKIRGTIEGDRLQHCAPFSAVADRVAHGAGVG